MIGRGQGNRAGRGQRGRGTRTSSIAGAGGRGRGGTRTTSPTGSSGRGRGRRGEAVSTPRTPPPPVSNETAAKETLATSTIGGVRGRGRMGTRATSHTTTSGIGRGRLGGVSTPRTPPPPVSKNETYTSPWQHSAAKEKLTTLLKDPLSYVHTMPVAEIYNGDELFKQYRWDRFKDNFKRLKTSVDTERLAVEFDQLAFDEEKVALPRNPTTRGHPFWDGHPAQALMKDDVKNRRLEGLKPKAVYELDERPEYREFPLSVLRNHLNKEKSKQIQSVYWQATRNQKGRTDHDVERELQIEGNL
jgi:hypothetical protein